MRKKSSPGNSLNFDIYWRSIRPRQLRNGPQSHKVHEVHSIVAPFSQRAISARSRRGCGLADRVKTLREPFSFIATLQPSEHF